jgi:hypothetical protein
MLQSSHLSFANFSLVQEARWAWLHEHILTENYQNSKAVEPRQGVLICKFNGTVTYKPRQMPCHQRAQAHHSTLYRRQHSFMYWLFGKQNWSLCAYECDFDDNDTGSPRIIYTFGRHDRYQSGNWYASREGNEMKFGVRVLVTSTINCLQYSQLQAYLST